MEIESVTQIERRILTQISICDNHVNFFCSTKQKQTEINLSSFLPGRTLIHCFSPCLSLVKLLAWQDVLGCVYMTIIQMHNPRHPKAEVDLWRDNRSNVDVPQYSSSSITRSQITQCRWNYILKSYLDTVVKDRNDNNIA